MSEAENISSGDTRPDCEPCGGTGTCDMCEGSGAKFSHYDENGEPVFSSEENCLHCYEGKIGKCGYCLGTGKYDPAFYNHSVTEHRVDQLENDHSHIYTDDFGISYGI